MNHFLAAEGRAFCSLNELWKSQMKDKLSLPVQASRLLLSCSYLSSPPPPTNTWSSSAESLQQTLNDDWTAAAAHLSSPARSAAHLCWRSSSSPQSSSWNLSCRPHLFQIFQMTIVSLVSHIKERKTHKSVQSLFGPPGSVRLWRGRIPSLLHTNSPGSGVQHVWGVQIYNSKSSLMLNFPEVYEKTLMLTILADIDHNAFYLNDLSLNL